MNKIIKNLSINNYSAFKNSFDNTKEIFWDESKSKLVHPGEYGAYREELAKRWLKLHVPQRFEIGSGFIISPDGVISTQCDLVIYDALRMPNIEGIENQKFYPIETVVCVGEIKSDINSKSQLNDYLAKLSELKKIRDSVKYPYPYYRDKWDCECSTEINPFDNISTFLICKKFNFNFKKVDINYGDIEQRYKHNFVLSLDDGLLCYYMGDKNVSCGYPFKANINYDNCYIKKIEEQLPNAVVTFLILLNNVINMTTLLEIDIAQYLTDNLFTPEKS